MLVNSNVFTSDKDGLKATIIGACGHLGQALAFQMKISSLVRTLALYDIKNSRHVALDLCHIDNSTKVNHFHGSNSLSYALEVLISPLF